MKLWFFLLACAVFPNSVLGHYELHNPNTGLNALTFDLIHRYLVGSNHESHSNVCASTNSSAVLQYCRFGYDVYALSTSGGNGVLIKSDYIELRGDGSYDHELLSTTKHYDSLRVAEGHGVDLSQSVSIPYADISILSGSNGQFRVETFVDSRICIGSTCTSYTDGRNGGYARHTINLGQQNLDVACEVNTQSTQNVENTLSGEHIYRHNSNASRFSQSIGAIDFSVNCVNWLPTQKSKTLTFSITPNTVVSTGGDTAVTCGAYRDSNPTTAPGYSMSKNITVPGFAGIDNEAYPTDEIYYGIYVSSPSTSAETSLTLDCALSGELSLGS